MYVPFRNEPKLGTIDRSHALPVETVETGGVCLFVLLLLPHLLPANMWAEKGTGGKARATMQAWIWG